MISEIGFARDFTSFWRVATPTMDGFVRRINSGLYVRDFSPMESEVSPSRRALINEIAFEAFCICLKERQSGKPHPDVAPTIAFAIQALQERGETQASDGDILPQEAEDIREQVYRLFRKSIGPDNIEGAAVRPPFLGCGIIDNCKGDILVGKTLFEVKAGERPFRSIDVRQLLIYLALNESSKQYHVSSVGLVNPRMGISVEMDISDFCFQISGRDPAGLLGDIVHKISSGDISR